MTSLHHLRHTVRAVVLGLAVALPISPVSAQSKPSTSQSVSKCDAFPKISWWQNLTHVKITNYINRKKDSNWKSYINKWSRQHDRLKAIQGRNGTAIIKAAGIKLKGATLADYVKQVGKRVDILRCLSLTAPKSSSGPKEDKNSAADKQTPG